MEPLYREMLFPEPSFTYPSGSPVKELRVPIERDSPFPEPPICLSKVPGN
jgi:hypothetical protein